MTARSSAILVIAALGAAIGCYNPQIVDGGLRCAPGNVCPENFRCASNGRCYRGDAGIDREIKPTCTSVTPDASTCSRAPATGQACNPACESGCSCGWCSVVNGAATCVMGTPGTKQIGDLCDPTKTADCAPGLACHAECGKGRCYKYCETSADCPTGAACNAAGGTLCSQQQDSTCNPVTMSGCPSGYGCYPTGSTPYCDCAGTVAPGAPCSVTRECTPGNGCVGTASSPAVCQKVCKTTTDCNGSGNCTLVGMYGYCL